MIEAGRSLAVLPIMKTGHKAWTRHARKQQYDTTAEIMAIWMKSKDP